MHGQAKVCYVIDQRMFKPRLLCSSQGYYAQAKVYYGDV